MNVVLIAIGCGLLAVLYGLVTIMQVMKAPAGNERMQDIASAIQEGARAYLPANIAPSPSSASSSSRSSSTSRPHFRDRLLIGALLRSHRLRHERVGRANVRTAEAAHQLPGRPHHRLRSRDHGMLVAGLPLAISGAFYYLTAIGAVHQRRVVVTRSSLAFGASLISIFARLGGGMFTKAADVGSTWSAVEPGSEDDPRNPATIADNVGDNRRLRRHDRRPLRNLCRDLGVTMVSVAPPWRRPATMLKLMGCR